MTRSLLLLFGLGLPLAAQAFSASWSLESAEVGFGRAFTLVVESRCAPGVEAEPILDSDLAPLDFRTVASRRTTEGEFTIETTRRTAWAWSRDRIVIPARAWSAQRAATGERWIVRLPELTLIVRSSLPENAALEPESRRTWTKLEESRGLTLAISGAVVAGLLAGGLFIVWRRRRRIRPSEAPGPWARLALIEGREGGSGAEIRDRCAELSEILREILGSETTAAADAAADPAQGLRDALDRACFAAEDPGEGEWRRLVKAARALLGSGPTSPAE